MTAKIIKLLLSNFSLTFFIIGLIAALLSLTTKQKPISDKTAANAFLSYFILFNIGIAFLYNFFCHTLMAEKVAQFIGWPNSPFQYEVAYASLGFSAIGFIAFRSNLSWKTASILGPALFSWGAAGGHLYQIIKAHNFSPGNAGVVFYTDIFLPIIGFYFLYKYYKLTKP